jgi:hypothetical protein
MLKVNAGYMDGFTEVILGERILERMAVIEVVEVIEVGERVQITGEWRMENGRMYLYQVNMIGAPLDTLGACVTGGY